MRVCLCACVNVCVCARVYARANGFLVYDLLFYETEQYLQLPVLKMHSFSRRFIVHL